MPSAAVPTWSGYQTIEGLDISFLPSWISSKTLNANPTQSP